MILLYNICIYSLRIGYYFTRDVHATLFSFYVGNTADNNVKYMNYRELVAYVAFKMQLI